MNYLTSKKKKKQNPCEIIKKSLVIGAALLLYMREQKGRDESDDLSLVRLLNNATRVLVGQKIASDLLLRQEAPQKP